MTVLRGLLIQFQLLAQEEKIIPNSPTENHPSLIYSTSNEKGQVQETEAGARRRQAELRAHSS